MKRRSKFALVVGVALLTGFVLADAVATAVLERQLPARMAEVADKPVQVDLQGWPAAARLLFGGLPRADAGDTGRLAPNLRYRPLRRASTTLDVAAASLAEAPGGVDEAHVGEGLWEVADELTAVGIDLLGQ